MKKALKFILSIGLAVLFLYLAFHGLDWKEFAGALEGTQWWFVALSMLAGTVALVFRAERWRLQLVGINQGITRSSIWHGSNIGNMFNVLLPGSGEFYRCAHVAGGASVADKVFGTIVMERSWDVLAIAVLLLGAVLGSSSTLLPFMQEKIVEPFMSRFQVSFGWVFLVALVVVAALCITVYVLRKKVTLCGRLCDAVSGILRGFTSFGSMPRKWLFALYTAGIWVMYILMTYFTFLAIPELAHLGFVEALFISAVGNIASVVPTPGNLGTYHYLVGIALSSLFIPAEMGLGEPGTIGLLCATLSHGSHALLLMVLAAWSWLALALKKKK